ncbi:hypothetical protein C0580_04540 [Candidatus Parcubacteria bacterium]|nr:MAG: hypothetical protein C0580_04540 [Candidatus Parcubacteria bacterium]
MQEITKEHVLEVCKLGQMGAHVCSYLVITDGQIACAKGTRIQQVIDSRREDGNMIAMGDNCEGRIGKVDPPEKKPE